MHNVVRHLLRRDRTVINKPLSALLVISGIYIFAFGMFSPIYAIFVEKIGGDIQTASNAWAIFMLTTGLLTFITGKWENELKERTLALAWAQFIIAGAYMMYYFADQVAMLYVAQVLMGVAAAFFWPAFHSLYGKNVDRKNAAWQWSFYDAIAYLVPAASAVLGGWIVKNYSFDAIFLIMAVLSVICGMYILLLPKKLI
jgi:predicted MFS family arabinose efflux permease